MAKIIIIGGGVSGLSAGIYAQMSGHSATVCERHGVAGGNLTSWKRNGYEIDNCIHWLTGTNPASPIYKMWEDLGALGEGVTVYRPESLYTCRKGELSLSLTRNVDDLRFNMLSISPNDRKETESFISAVRLMQRICKIGGERHNEGFQGAKDYLHFPALAKYYYLTVRELSLRFKHPLLRDFIGSFWEDDFGALALIFVFAHFCGDNGDLPEFGSKGMAERIEQRFLSLGGKLMLKKEAVKINHANGKAQSVSFSDGSVLSADYVILTTDPQVTFKRLLNLPVPYQLQKLYDNPRMKRFSSIQCAFACNLSDLDFSGDLVIDVSKKHLNTIGSSKIVLREFSHEKSYAPDGMTVLQSMIFCDEKRSLDIIKLKKSHKSDYLTFKKNFASATEEIIKKNLKNSAADLKLLDVWTPATYKRYTASDIGSYMSFIMPSKIIPSRKSNRIKGLSNVILATQWQQCPGGLPIAAVGGRAAIKTVDQLEAAPKRARERKLRPQTAAVQ